MEMCPAILQHKGKQTRMTHQTLHTKIAPAPYSHPQSAQFLLLNAPLVALPFSMCTSLLLLAASSSLCLPQQPLPTASSMCMSAIPPHCRQPCYNASQLQQVYAEGWGLKQATLQCNNKLLLQWPVQPALVGLSRLSSCPRRSNATASLRNLKSACV